MSIQRTPENTAASTETALSTLEKSATAAKSAASSYLVGAQASLYLQGTSEVAERLCSMLGITDKLGCRAVQGATPIVAAALAEAVAMPRLAEAAQQAALAQGVVHGNAFLAPLREQLGEVFAPLLRAHSGAKDAGAK